MKSFNAIIRWMLVLLWMLLIFYLSHQPADKSAGLSGDLSEIIIENVEKLTSIDIDIDVFHHILRKNAHFFAYFILSILVLNALKWGGLTGYSWIGIALAICVTYAIGDEVHQLFIPGRSGEIKDVFIDSAGALAGILTYMIFRRIIENLKALISSKEWKKA